MTTDNLYTTSLAHRSIARAALHLGIEGMETKALEALGGVLVDYLEKIGSTISNNVERSGRSSAHVNVYDVLNAIEECTCPAADHLASSIVNSSNAGSLTNGHGAAEMESSQATINGGWEGLASFLFGPNWHLIQLEGEDPLDISRRLAGGDINSIKESEGIQKSTGGKTMSTLMSSTNVANASTASAGKQLPRLAASASPSTNTTGNDKNVSFSFERQGSIDPVGESVPRKSPTSLGSGRWHAPYLENVKPFPIVSSSGKDSSIANPHRLGPTSKSLHDLALEREACRDLYTLKRKASDLTTDSNKKKATNSQVLENARRAEEVARKEALMMPDEICLKSDLFYWGCIREDNDIEMKYSLDDGKPITIAEGDKKTTGTSTFHTNATENAKVKLDAPTSTSNPKSDTKDVLLYESSSKSSRFKNPSYIPNFMPPFPPSKEVIEHDLQLSVTASKVMGSILSHVTGTRDKTKSTARLQTKEKSGDKADIENVRQSVLALGKSKTYWGSGWQNSKDNSANDKDSFTYSIGVAPGQSSGLDAIVSSDSVTKDSTGLKKPTADLQVNPLGRASGSRVSKILEGSMS